MKFTRICQLVTLLSLIVLPACGGGGGGQSTAPTASVDALLLGTPAAGLLSFHATVTEVRLDGPAGASSNLISTPIDVEFAGLEDVAQWLASRPVPAGSYDTLVVHFAPGSMHARATDGTPLTVTATDTVWHVELTEELNIAAGERKRVAGRLDLALSLGGIEPIDPADPLDPIPFDPDGDDADPDGDMNINSVFGLVTGVDAPASRIEFDGFADADQTIAYGAQVAEISSSTLLVDEDGDTIASAASFFSALEPGQTRIKVRGSLRVNGIILAERIEIEDAEPRVRIRGRVLSIGGSVFELLIQDVRSGAETVDSVLSGIGNPASIDVLWDDQTAFFVEGDEVGSSADLSVGQTLVVEFEEFDSSPFLAREVDIENRHAEFNGTIVDTSDLPDSFLLAVSSDDFCVVYDQLEEGDHVRVLLENAELFLGIQGQPELVPEDLVVGMRARVRGELMTGEEEESVIEASEVRIHHGHFIKGDASSLMPDASTFVSSGVQIVQTFGDMVDGGPLTVHIEPDAHWHQDAASEEAFYELADNLAGDEELDIKVKGIGAGFDDEVRAFDIKVKVRTIH